MLHVLVFAYWLGGDIGAFTASFTLTDSRQSPSARLAAAKILDQVDMAPRSALILMLPTGLTLAIHRGWIAIPVEALMGVWAVSLVWLAVLWVQHARHASSKLWRSLDMCIRIVLILGLTAATWFSEPLFLKIKFACLAFATAMGIAIRIAIAPMGTAIAQLANGTASSVTDRTIAKALGIGRPMVVCIWICLLIAAWAGIARPV
jgi:hypothetical protein